jgi:malate dehydrogenase
MRRNKIALIGGGQIGGVAALMAARRGSADILLLDIPEKEGVVKGKALDILALRPYYGADVSLTGSSDYGDLAGADVVIVTAGLPRRPGMAREDLLEINLRIVRRVAEAVKTHAPDAFVILTTNPLDAMVYAFYKYSGFSRQKIVGMAGLLDSARFRTFVAEETGLSVQDATGLVMGGHGPLMIPLVRTATVGGVPITDLLPRERIDAIIQRTRDAGTEVVQLLGEGSAYFSPAAAVIEMAEAYLKDKKRVIPSAALCQGEYGIQGYFIGVPCVIGAGGVERIIEFQLTDEEQKLLDANLAEVQRQVAATGL